MSAMKAPKDPPGQPPVLHRPTHPVRFVTAASLFDGHDAAINIMRRLLQAQGVEVIHLGHNRSVEEVVTAAIQEDVQGVAVSSYQGGHVEYFHYLVDRLRAAGRGDVRVYGGGGGTIVAAEIEELHRYGVARIFSPQDGQAMGLAAMVNTMVADCDHPLSPPTPEDVEALLGGDHRALARVITAAETDVLAGDTRALMAQVAARAPCPRPRHHRHRRLREIVADRRVGPAPAPRPGGQAAGRHPGYRPHPAQGRRCPTRRPDPHELHRCGRRRRGWHGRWG